MIGMGDHPRVCGEHLRLSDLRRINPGSSPRVRGTRAVRAACGRAGGIIPAYAGNTSGYPYRRWRSWDHPRVCGEHKVDDSTGEGAWGSSPRMRGTLRRAFRKFRRLGIIPAYAGNTKARSSAQARHQDHPRVCGEHHCKKRIDQGQTGSSPRMRGTHFAGEFHVARLGIIPAYAGNTNDADSYSTARRDHPRVCGEHDHHLGVVPVVQGSSPRMRGTRSCTARITSVAGIIPAYAGNTD